MLIAATTPGLRRAGHQTSPGLGDRLSTDRFVAVTWNLSDGPEARQAAVWINEFAVDPAWRRIADYPGLSLFCRQTESERSSVVMMDGVHGAIVGAVFRKNAEPAARLETIGRLILISFLPRTGAISLKGSGDNTSLSGGTPFGRQSRSSAIRAAACPALPPT